MGFGQYWTSLCLASSSVPSQPCIQFLFVSSRVCVRLPSDSTSPWTPLSFANSSYCQACSGLSPPSLHPCRAHIKKPTFTFECWFFRENIKRNKNSHHQYRSQSRMRRHSQRTDCLLEFLLPLKRNDR